MEQDSRLSGIKPEFARIIAHVCAASVAPTTKGGKKKHVVMGELTVCPDPTLPSHASLPPGAKFPAFIYHSGTDSTDEASVDLRRGALRLFTPESRSACAWITGGAAQEHQGTADNPHAADEAQAVPVKRVFHTCKELGDAMLEMVPAWDLIMSTSSSGRFSRGGNAQVVGMTHKLKPTPEKLEAFWQSRPHLREAAWDALFYAPESYTDLPYLSSLTTFFHCNPPEGPSPDATSERLFQSQGGQNALPADSAEHQARYARYRLVSKSVLESGNLTKYSVPAMPPEVFSGYPEVFPRESNDTRPEDYLGKELLERVLADGGHKYILQVQLHAKTHSAAEEERVLDATLAWDEVTSPWRSLAVLHLYAALTDPDDEARINFGTGLGFNPWIAPPGLGIPLGTASNQTASVGQLRTVVYSYYHYIKTGKALPAPLQDLMARYGPKPGSGASPSGALQVEKSPALPAPLGATAGGLSGAAVAPNGQLLSPGGSARQERVAAQGPPGCRVWDADTRIAVVGAGIGGLAAALQLKRLGYTHVEVLEADAAVGGMCQGMDVAGLWYDLGGQFLARGASPTVSRLAAELGAEWEELGNVFGGVVELETKGTVRPLGAAKRQAVKAHQVLRSMEKATKMGDAVSSPLASFMGSPEAARSIFDSLSALSITPEEVEQALLVFTASGYGFPGHTPAMYFHQFLQVFLGEPRRLKEGYQNLVERMAASLDVRCGVRVQEVVRRPGLAPQVLFEGGRAQEYDKVIVTGGAWLAAGLPQGCIAWTPKERALMERPQHRRFYTTLASVAEWESRYPPGVYFIGGHCADPTMLGHCVAFQRCHSGSDVFLFWAYARAHAPPGEVTDHLRDDVAKMRGVLGHVHVQRSWDYAHQLSEEDIKSGKWLHQFDTEVQGKGSVFYLGGVLSFESTECNAAAAESLVARHFSMVLDNPPQQSAQLQITARPGVTSGSSSRGDHARENRAPEVAATPVHLFGPVEEEELKRRDEVAAKSPAPFPNVDEHLRHQARALPTKVAYVHVDGKCHVAAALTFAQLDAAAEAFAERLKRGGSSEGDRVILMFPPDRPLDFLQAFFGCVRGRLVPVPLAPVNPGGSKAQVGEGRGKLELIVRACGARILLTTGKVLLANRVQAVTKLFGKRSEPTTELKWVATDKWAPVAAWTGGDLGAATVSRGENPVVNGQTAEGVERSGNSQAMHAGSTTGGLSTAKVRRTAADTGQEVPSGNSGSASGEKTSSVCFLMYTSGSTGDPKGVMVGHANLMHNLGEINTVWSESSRCVSWLPLWHDMGLIAAALCPVVSGAAAFLISPLSFIQNPVLWLEACSKFRATVTQAPAFALDLVARKYGAYKGTLDLASLRLVFCGAEPISPRSLQTFAATFAAAGFRSSALMCAYGLAENVVYVSSQWGDVSEVDGRVSCGQVRPARYGMDVRIVDAETGLEAADGREGEIWIHSRSVCMGYWNRPDVSRQVFGGSLDGDPSGKTFLRTGDLGKIVTGQLYVTGRLKDMIIVRGANVYPQDIERFVQDSEEGFIRPGGIVALQAPTPLGEAEGVLILAEARDRKNLPGDLPRRLKCAVEGTLGVGVTAVCIIAPKSSSKTTSGKVRRKDMLRRWGAGELDILAQINADPRSQLVPKAVQNAGITLPTSVESQSRAGSEVALCRRARPAELPAAATGGQQHLRIRESLARLVGLDGPQIQDSMTWQRPLAELGVDSLKAAELVEGINAEFGIDLDMECLAPDQDGGTSLAALAEIVSSALGLAPEVGFRTETEPRMPPPALTLERSSDPPPVAVMDQQLSQIRESLARLVGLDHGQKQDSVTWQRPLAELGVDSLKAAELVEGINAEYGLDLDMECLAPDADGGTSLAALAEVVSSALGLAPEVETQTEPEPRMLPPVALPLEQNPSRELVTGRPGRSDSDAVQAEAFRRGQVPSVIRMLPTVDMRLAAARATIVAAVNAYLPGGMLGGEGTPANDSRRLEVLLLERIEGGGKMPDGTRDGGAQKGRAEQNGVKTPLGGRPGGQVDRPLPTFIQLPIIFLIATIVPVLSFVVPGIPAGFILAQTFVAHLDETPQACSLAALRDTVLMLVAYSTFGVCQGIWAVLFKWLVIGRYKPGRYSLWGWYHIRWWCVNTTVSLASVWIPEAPFLHWLLLSLGGTKIGRGVEGLRFAAVPEMDLLTVGRGSTFGGRFTALVDRFVIQTASFEPGTLILRAVRVGERCWIGTNAVLGGGCDVGDDVVVRPFTAVDSGMTLRAGPSPLHTTDAKPDEVDMEEGLRKHTSSVPATSGSSLAEPGFLTEFLWGATYGLLLAVAAVACLQPCVALAHVLAAGYPDAHRVVWGAVLVGLYYLFMTLMIGTSVAVKWVLLGKVKPRVFHPVGWFAMRRFLVERFIAFASGSLAFYHLRSTYWNRWLVRMYGGRLPKKVWGNIHPCADIDLLTFGGGSVSGGGAMYKFETEAQSGCLRELRPIVIGNYCVVGQKTMIGAGTVLEDGAAVGLLTNVPVGTHLKSQQVILGPDAKIMMRRSPMDIDRPIYTASQPLWVIPLDAAIWLLLVGIAGSLGGLYVLAITSVAKSGVHLAVRMLFWAGITLIFQVLFVAAICGTALLVKLLLVGDQKRHPIIESTNSAYIAFLERHTFLSTILVPMATSGSLNGTLFGVWFWRLLGARVSSSAYLHNCYAYDHDWITIDKHVAVNRFATISPHVIWEGSRGRLGPLEIGEQCTLEPDAVILPCTMGVGVTVRRLSHPPAHNFLRAGTIWQGVPARVVSK